MAAQKFSRVKFASFFPNVPRKFVCRNAKTLVPHEETQIFKKWFRSVIRHLILGSALATAELMTPPMRSCAWAISWRQKRVQWLSGSEIKTCRAWVGLSSFLGLNCDTRNQCNLIIWYSSIISIPHVYQIEVLPKNNYALPVLHQSNL